MTLVTTERHGETAVIVIDNPPVNALSHGVRDGLLSQVVAADEDNDCKVIVIRCDGRTFIAGADIKEFGKPPQEPFLPDVVARIEKCRKPVVAALHGTALGGGLEVAMGCHYRIAATSAAMGLPEVNLGLLPGASGTQRLPRLIGTEKALDIMLSGKPVDASQALAIGVIDRVSNAPDLEANALAFAREAIPDGPRRISAMTVPEVDPGFFEATRKKLAHRIRGQIAPGRIIDCVEVATQMDFEQGLAKEREYFQECLASPQSAGLRHAFFAERQVNKVPGIGKDTPVRDCTSAAIIGAGTMGAGIAYSCLAAGLAVTLLDNSDEGLERGRKTVEGLYAGGVKRGKLSESDMEEGLSRFATSQDYAVGTNWLAARSIKSPR